MADSKRQKIIDAIDTRLKTILVTGGYETDLGQNVFAWRATALQESELPGLIYRDVSEEITAEDVPIGQHEHILLMEAEIVVASGSTTGSQIRKMIADVIKAIGTDPYWSTLADWTRPEGDEINVEQAEKIIGGATVRFTVIYRTKQWDAYA